MIIIDTNVLVSGLLTSDENAPTASILNAALTATAPYVLSPALLNEYRQVLLRSAIVKCHGLSEPDIDELLTSLVQNAVWLKPYCAVEAAPDPGDQHLWNLLATRLDAVLITGDRLLLESAHYKNRVVSPAEYLANRLGCDT